MEETVEKDSKGGERKTVLGFLRCRKTRKGGSSFLWLRREGRESWPEKAAQALEKKQGWEKG